VKLSDRSWLLLLGSTLAPITVGSLRVASLEQRRFIAGYARWLLGFDAGLVPDILFFSGILCFTGFLLSLLFDYFHSRRSI
jgi:hypothetical protein